MAVPPIQRGQKLNPQALERAKMAKIAEAAKDVVLEKCKACDSTEFLRAIQMKRVSGILLGQPEAVNLFFDIFICAKCKEVYTNEQAKI